MSVPTNRRDILDRTMVNLAVIEKAAKLNAPDGTPSAFDTTQLVNSFLMTLIQHWDELEDDWSHLPQKGVQWPTVKTSILKQAAKDCIGKIRDALAHGLFAFEGESGEIVALHLWTCPDRTTVDWHATLSINDMRSILACFVQLAKGKKLPFRPTKNAGDPCR